MKKAIVLGVLSVLFLCSGQKVQADVVYRYEDNHLTFKKVIHVLDDIINNDYRRHKHAEKVVVVDKRRVPERVVVIKNRRSPRKVVVVEKKRAPKKVVIYKDRHPHRKIKKHKYSKYRRHGSHGRNHYVKTCRLYH